MFGSDDCFLSYRRGRWLPIEQRLHGVLGCLLTQAGATIVHGLCQDLLNNFAMHVGQAEVAALEAIGQPLVVQAQQVQDRGL
jgi:hypothetical protein